MKHLHKSMFGEMYQNSFSTRHVLIIFVLWGSLVKFRMKYEIYITLKMCHKRKLCFNAQQVSFFFVRVNIEDHKLVH